jgi:hypothetical protein
MATPKRPHSQVQGTRRIVYGFMVLAPRNRLQHVDLVSLALIRVRHRRRLLVDLRQRHLVFQHVKKE